MPFLLLAGMGFSAFFAAIASLVAVAFIIMMPFAGKYWKTAVSDA